MQNALLPAAVVTVALFASVGVAQDRATDSNRRGVLGGGEPVTAPSLGGESIFGQNRFVVQQDGQYQLPPLLAPTTDVSEIGNGIVPENFTDAADVAMTPIPEGPDRAGDWAISAYLWQAPNTFSNTLYFEDAMLERHGHERFPVLQPLISGGRFFATFPMLPYLATIRPPCDTQYTLGYFRPGPQAPALLQRPPYQRNAALVEAAAVAGAIVAFP